jgi:hypothetical protein
MDDLAVTPSLSSSIALAKKLMPTQLKDRPPVVAEFADERIRGGPIRSIVDRYSGSLGGEQPYDCGADSAVAPVARTRLPAKPHVDVTALPLFALCLLCM